MTEIQTEYREAGKPGNLPWIVCCFALGTVIALYGICLWSAYPLCDQTHDTSKWTSTVGKIKGFEQNSDNINHKYTGPSIPNTVWYFYRVNSRLLNSSRVRLTGTTAGDGSKYPSGTDVTVHFNPENPNDAILETYTEADYNDAIRFQKISGALVFLAGLAIFAAAFVPGLLLAFLNRNEAS